MQISSVFWVRILPKQGSIPLEVGRLVDIEGLFLSGREGEETLGGGKGIFDGVFWDSVILHCGIL